jgi:hypothetical protein
MTPATSRRVTVAGGGELISDAIAHNCKFMIQGRPFTADFRILKLPGSDIILGVNWFTLHNPVTFDFVGRKLTIDMEGDAATFSDHLIPNTNLLILSEECSKLIEQGASGYFLFQGTDNSEEPTPPIHDALASLLEQFQDISSAPEGLPPKREIDHHIPLLPGTTPPNIRPYRMSHSQKNTIEAIIKQMLQNKEIRPSCSPYSSPIILVRKKDKSWLK